MPCCVRCYRSVTSKSVYVQPAVGDSASSLDFRFDPRAPPRRSNLQERFLKTDLLLSASPLSLSLSAGELSRPREARHLVLQNITKRSETRPSVSVRPSVRGVPKNSSSSSSCSSGTSCSSCCRGRSVSSYLEQRQKRTTPKYAPACVVAAAARVITGAPLVILMLALSRFSFFAALRLV